MIIKAGLLALFVAVSLAVGFAMRSRNRSVDSFVLGGRSVGPWLTAFAYGTSYFSAVVFVGYAGQFGWRFGISAIWIGLGNAFIGSLLAWVVLARRTRLITRHLGSATMPDFFGKRLNSSSLKLAASVITFIFLIPYTASLYNGLSRLFEMAYHVDFVVCIVIMAVITGVYVIIGGYTATAINDFIQGIIMLLGIVLVVGAVLNVNGGFAGSLKALSNVGDPATTDMPGAFASIFGPNPLDLLGVVLLTSVGTWGLPQMVAKYYSIKSEKNISTGTVISTVFAIFVSGGCYFLGGFGRLFPVNVAVQGYDAVIPAMLSGFSDWLIGVVIVLVFAASISTLSSLVMSSASTFTLDFLRGRIVKDMDEKKQLKTIRLLIAVFIVIASVIAIVQYKGGLTFIAQMMGISWGTLAGAFLAPFLYSLYGRWLTRAAVWVNFIFAMLVMILNVFARPSFPAIIQSPINCGAFVMLAGLVIVPAVSLVTPKLGKDHLDSVFSCIEPDTDGTGRQFLKAE
ncbi:MAG: sodium:solute symporter [Oscillospiraceae bacterium]|nr:sodium:solute symporter [Oscillospiraceae bacterium]